ncbi:MAG TPA: amidohydrolase family protein [Candidatus Brocadiia bacterium]|nr:amidohydrolase family protein [Candidatus Brocadiia bacterium]
MLIDIHAHTCRRRAIGPTLKWTFVTPDEMLSVFDAHGITQAVLLPLVSPECQRHPIEPEEVLAIAAEHPGRFIPFCNLDPRMIGNSPKTDFLPMLDFYKQAGCKGVGEYTANLPFDDPMQMNVFKQVEEIGLPLLFHVGHTLGGCYGCYDDLGLPRLEKVLQTCPNLRLLGHSQAFWAEISADCTQENRGKYPTGKVTPGRVVQLMRQYPNLYGDLSAGSGYTAITRDPDFGLAFLTEFQDRLLFGTDLCWPGQQMPIVAWFNKVRQDELLPADAWEKIAWKNAQKLLNLDI